MYGNFKNLKRAIQRGHIMHKENSIHGGISLFRRVKSDKVGAGNHSRWVKGFPAFGPQKWTRA
jgi:hypothetical protein